MDDFEGFRAFMEEITADVIEGAEELELEVEPENVTELLQSYDKKYPSSSPRTSQSSAERT